MNYLLEIKMHPNLKHIKSIKTIKSIVCLGIFALLLPLCTKSQDNLPDRPNPPQLVNNLSASFSGLTPQMTYQLEQKLVRFSDSTSNQIAIVIVDDLKGLEPEQYATHLGAKWGIGQKDKQNGIVILVKPTGGQGERKVFIAVGRGLEGAIPDLIAHRIVEQEILPNFKKGNFYEGLDAATSVLMSLAKGEFNYKQYASKKERTPPLLPLIIVVIIFALLFFSSRGGGGGYTMGSGGAFLGGALLGSMFGSGGGRSSGGDGGGFGGFGGGDFGGGGAGGSW